MIKFLLDEVEFNSESSTLGASLIDIALSEVGGETFLVINGVKHRTGTTLSNEMIPRRILDNMFNYYFFVMMLSTTTTIFYYFRFVVFFMVFFMTCFFS